MICPSGAFFQITFSSHTPFARFCSIAFAVYPDSSAAFLIVTHFMPKRAGNALD
jgi:hypothetical protein